MPDLVAIGLGEPWHALESCASTNDELGRLAMAGASAGTVVIAETQTAGRGRQGRSWQSGEPGNLYASVLLRPSLSPARAAALSLVVGVAVARAIGERGVAAQLKWPNDIVIGRRKLGGILAEASSRGGALEHVVVGVGLNIVSAPPSLVDQAVSLAEFTSRLPAPPELFRDILSQLAPLLAAYDRDGLAEIGTLYASLWRDRGRPAKVESGGVVIEGTAQGIGDHGALLLERPNGQFFEVVAGDVEIDYA